jgi:hypothetical protein
MEEEKRKTYRIKKLLIAQYSKDGISWDISHIRDFSETGMQITTSTSFTVGETLQFRSRIPLEPFAYLEFLGRVIDCVELKTRFDEPVSDMYITRIEFVNLQDNQRALLRKYIAWFLTRKR